MTKKKLIILDIVLFILLALVTMLIIKAYPDNIIERVWLYLWSYFGMFKASQMFTSYICKHETYEEDSVDGEEKD